jgi:alcohol dehydrogenase class IV
MFELCSVGRIVFGRGQLSRLGELAAPLGRTALVVANGSAELHQRVTELLARAGLRAVIVRQHGEPTVDDVDRALNTARQEGCDFVLGVGGGSAIDLAKAVAGLLTNGGSALDYLEVVGSGKKITRPAAPWIAVPCTAGTGAEATKNAVIGYPPGQFKASLRSEHLLARIALIDPELGVSVLPEITARCGMDALCQLIEAYTSKGAHPMTDALALEGLGRAARSLRRACTNGADVDAREDMALAALLSGIALANAGLGAVHGLAAPLGARCPVPHGAACAALLPHVMAANVAALRVADATHPVLARYATVGRTLTAQSDLDAHAAVDAGIAWARDIARDLHIPPLRHFGLTPTDIPTLVTLAQKASSMRFNPVVLPGETLHAVLGQAL